MLDPLLELTTASMPILLLVAFLVAFGESVPGLGFLLPGEMTIVGMSSLVVTPSQTLSLWLTVAAGAVVGDHLGYGIGRRHGDTVRTWPLLRRVDATSWVRAETVVRRRGPHAILASRPLPVIRTLVPVVAGIAGLARRSLTLASVAGCLVWAACWVVFGTALRATLGPLAIPALVGAALVTLVVVAVLVRLRVRREASCPTPL